MASAVSSSVFSIPLRPLHAGFSGQVSGNPVQGLMKFIGDGENDLLRFMADGGSVDSSLWPIVFFGPTGSGKTALASNLIDRSCRFGADPFLIEAADFARKFKSAIQVDSVAAFRDRILESGGILIDRLDDLSHDSATQLEIARLIDLAVSNSLPFALTCRGLPAASSSLNPRLSSRLSAGLNLPVHVPGDQARKQIIGELAQTHGLHLTGDAVELLSGRLKVSVPGINQFLSRISTVESETMPDGPVTSAWFEQLFSNLKVENERRYSDEIIKLVAREMNLKPTDLKGNSRKQSIVLARSVAIYLCRTMLGSSFVKIGSRFGNRDHSTIMHACKKIGAMLETNNDAQTVPATVKMIHHLQQKISTSFARSVSQQSPVLFENGES